MWMRHGSQRWQQQRKWRPQDFGLYVAQAQPRGVRMGRTPAPNNYRFGSS